mmetsp:Transcript_20070/g.43197  ORF Transcript_20070/g.43197 Transcript_20070/m.43197 type:complete len:217 (+) Transcript_20070:315-965(+)
MIVKNPNEICQRPSTITTFIVPCCSCCQHWQKSCCYRCWKSQSELAMFGWPRPIVVPPIGRQDSWRQLRHPPLSSPWPYLQYSEQFANKWRCAFRRDAATSQTWEPECCSVRLRRAGKSRAWWEPSGAERVGCRPTAVPSRVGTKSPHQKTNGICRFLCRCCCCCHHETAAAWTALVVRLEGFVERCSIPASPFRRAVPSRYWKCHRPRPVATAGP